MAAEAIDQVVQLLFAKLLSKYKLTSVLTKGTVHALRAIMTAGELNRMAHILASLLCKALSPAEEQLLADYQVEVLEKLRRDHIFLAINDALSVIRRPELLESYTYAGMPFVAISERRLVGAENGTLKIFELAEFTYLPRKSRSVSIEEVCRLWGLPSSKILQFLDRYFYEVPLKEQEDIFFDAQEILVRYKDGKFVGSSPAPGPIPTISVLRKRLKKPSPTAPENVAEDLCESLLRPSCSVSSGSQVVDPGTGSELEDI
jgi:hypothetical protein